MGKLRGEILSAVNLPDRDLKLRCVRLEANTGLRTKTGSFTLRKRKGGEPHSESNEPVKDEYVGAFGTEHWLDEWTFIVLEWDYDTREVDGSERGR